MTFAHVPACRYVRIDISLPSAIIYIGMRITDIAYLPHWYPPKLYFSLAFYQHVTSSIRPDGPSENCCRRFQDFIHKMSLIRVILCIRLLLWWLDEIHKSWAVKSYYWRQQGVADHKLWSQLYQALFWLYQCYECRKGQWWFFMKNLTSLLAGVGMSQ